MLKALSASIGKSGAAIGTVVTVCLASAPVSYVFAYNWVQITEVDRSICVDMATIETDSNGFTYYRYKVCAGEFIQPERAVLCSNDSDAKIKIYVHGPDWYEEMVDPKSIAARIAAWVCHLPAKSKKFVK